jgi:hypothetical protein
MSTAHPNAALDPSSTLGQLIHLVERVFSQTVAPGDPWHPVVIEWQRVRATGFSGMTPLLQRVLDQSAVPGQTTVWCTRWHHPVTCLFLLYCHTGSSSVGHWLDALVTERELVALGEFALSMHERRLQVCPARTRAEFVDALQQAVAGGGTVRVLCDWRLDKEEWAAAKEAVGHSAVDLGELLVVPEWPMLPADLQAEAAPS